MNKTEIIIKQWMGQENIYGNPVDRPDSEIWKIILQHFQKNPTHHYLKHFHEYKFSPEVPERIEGVGIGRSRVGTYTEVLTIYWQDKK